MTNNLRERFQLHNQGKVYSTSLRRPFEIIYFEGHHDKHDAAIREQFLKTGWGKNWIKKTLSNYLKKFGG